jgi:FkbM family methyltransferase
MERTSEISYKDVSVEVPKYDQDFYKDNYVQLYVEGFTNHVRLKPTRYNPAFAHFLTDNIIGISLEYYGEYTEQEINLLRNFINSETIIYDIGANIGYHTNAFAKFAKHVYAFEPNELNYKLLEINTFHDKNVTRFDYAISNDIGVTQIEKFELGKPGNYGECRLTEDGQLCDMTYIDYLVRTKTIEPPHVIKIDVEGHEYPVFEGMSETIKNHLPVIFYEAMHCDLASIYDMLKGLGYALHYFPCANYNPNNFYKNQQNIFGQGGVLNILAIPFHVDAKTNLPEVISRDDTWELAVKRIQEANAKQN